MPRTTFAGSLIDGANGGLGRLAQSIAQGRGAYQDSFDRESTLQSRLAQALAHSQQQAASADKLSAEAAQHRAETQLLHDRPDRHLDLAAYASDSSLPMVRAVAEAARTGMPAAYDDVGPEPDGSALRTLVPADVKSRISQALLRYAPVALNAKDFKIDDWAQAQGAYRNADLGNDVLAGRRKAGDVGASQAAVAGKPLYNAESNGSVLDLFGGALDTENPMAQSTMGLKGAQAKQAAAGAVENLAQARAADAAAGLRKTQSGAVGAGPGKVPVGYRYTSDPETGALRLEPIPGGPKDPNAQTGKPLPSSAAKGYLDNQTNLRRAQKALDLAQGMTVGDAVGDEDATGFKGMLPMGLLNRIDTKGVDTRAAIADLGSLVIHDRSGAAVTASEMPRLAPFIPSATDNHDTSIKKLKQFVQNYRDIVDSAGDFYRASGFNVPTHSVHSPTPARAAPAAGGFTYLGKEE